ncbi:choice-of-anchor H family protein [candidate division KSB1 bacterium]|nr:choice-of-anchor H family protein [candidate division KSB1 bacterium]
MKTLHFCFILLCLMILSVRCTKDNPTKPSATSTPTVTIKNIWFSEKIDDDKDDFYTYARLNFDLDTNMDHYEIIAKIGVRNHSDKASDLYDLYFESTLFTINGETVDDAVYMEIGSPNDELDKGNYDFLLQIFASSAPKKVIAEASPTTHLVLSNVQFEKTIQETAGKWLTSSDDGIFEGDYNYSPRTGAGTNAIAQKFEKPVSTASKITKIRIHVAETNISGGRELGGPSPATFTIYSDQGSLPYKALYSSESYSIQSTGWYEFNVEFDITNIPVFYVSMPPPQGWAISTDHNSISTNGYRYYWVTSNPPREGWEKLDYNFGIDVFTE